jgi:hypothetical protein
MTMSSRDRDSVDVRGLGVEGPVVAQQGPQNVDQAPGQR